MIPDKFKDSSKISTGFLTLEIEKTARSTGNSELAEIIKNLSEQGVRKLLTLGSGRYMIMTRPYESEQSFSTPPDLHVFRELEEKGLLVANEDFDGFIKYLKTLGAEERTIHFNGDGSFTKIEDDGGEGDDDEGIQYVIPLSKLSSADYKRVDNFGVELSENGRKAFDIIVRVIAEQIDE